MRDSLKNLAVKQARWDSIIAEKQNWIDEGRKHRLKSRDKSIPEMKEFYEGNNVLITGGTGFLGKVLIEKLLRSLPDLGNIYVIVRPKKNQDPGHRMTTIFNTDLFDLVRSERPDVFKKVVPIVGDMSSKGIGISMEDRALLQAKVSIVFHGAATVRFDDPLKSAILLNTRGTHELVELSKGIKNLKSFVHISTTYCNTDQPVTQEKVYPTPFDWRDIIKIAETTSSNDLQPVAPKIIGFQPNTYTFTKQLSEKVVDDARHQIPVFIVRPAVVVSAASEPIVGWSDNLYGPAGFCMGIMKGVLRGFYIDSMVNLNTVPVDSVAKLLITAAWLRGTNQNMSENPSDTNVLNLSGEEICDATYRDMFTTVPCTISKLHPTSLRAPRVYKTKNIHYYYYKLYTSHILFAMSLDFILKLAGRQPRLMKVTRAIHSVNMALRYFLFQNFYNSTEILWKSMSYTTDPDFHHKLAYNYMDTSTASSTYIYQHVLKDTKAGPYRQQILGFAQTYTRSRPESVHSSPASVFF